MLLKHQKEKAMVKKIRVIDETPEETEVSSTGAERDYMEIAKSMDWKLWEMLQIMQRLEKSLKGVSLNIDDDK